MQKAFRKIKTPTLVIVLLFMQQCTMGQFTQTIRGTVVDNIVGNPLQGATLTITKIKKITETDAQGIFRMDNIPVGIYTLQISYTGYKENAIANLVVDAGKEVVLTIALEQDVKRNADIVVKGNAKKNKPLNDMSIVSARAFTVEETQRYAAAVNDPLRMATNFAGVASVDDGNNNVSIRGNAPTGLLWRMEGIDIPNPNHFGTAGGSGGGVSILSSQLLANSDFVTGAFASEYGNALSGVFDLKLRKGNNEKREYTLQAGILGLNATAEGPFKKGYKGSYLINYRYSTLNVLAKLKVFNLKGVSTNFQDLSYNIFLPTKKIGNFSLFGFNGLSTQEVTREKDSSKWLTDNDRFNSTYKSLTQLNGITHNLLISPKTNIKTALALSVTNSAVDVDYLERNYSFTRVYQEDYTTKKWVLSTTLNYKLNAKNSFRMGAIINFIDFNYLLKSKENINLPLKETIRTKDKTQTIQGFAQWQYKPSNKVTLNAGLHYLTLLYNNTASVEPRASARWNINKKNSLALGYGMHSQLQGLGVYFAQLTNASGIVTNPNKNLKLSKAHHIVLSHSHSITNNLKIKTEIYYQHLFKIPVSVSDTNTFSTLNIEGDYVTDPLTNKGKGKNYGLEISVEKYLSYGFYYMWSNSFYQSKYTAADGKERNTRFNGNYISNIVAGKEFVSSNGKRTIGLNLKLVYSGGYRQTPIDVEKSRLGGYTVYRQKEAFTIQNPAYFRTDLRASIKWNKKRITSILSLDLQNVSNRKNVFSSTYDVVSEKVITNYQTGLIPILNYKIEF
jgi:Carboxypeptidase regulatory-like domain